MTADEILNDFKRRYESTYVMVQEPNSSEEMLYLVERIEADEHRAAVFHLFSNEVGRIKINYGSAHTVKFVPPPVGVFQYGGDALVCFRLPQKQYRRGICSDNCRIYHTATAITREQGQMDMETISAAFAKKVYQPKEALDILAKGKYRSVALPDNFSLTLSFSEGSKDYVLFFWTMPVARVNNEGKITSYLEAVFTKQINKLFGA